jgi:hypothetical protein
MEALTICFSLLLAENLNKKYGKDLRAVEAKKGKWKRLKRAAGFMRAGAGAGGAGAGAGAGGAGMPDAQLREQLIAFYAKHEPSKVDQVDTIIANKVDPKRINALLIQKYGEGLAATGAGAGGAGAGGAGAGGAKKII